MLNEYDLWNRNTFNILYSSKNKSININIKIYKYKYIFIFIQKCDENYWTTFDSLLDNTFFIKIYAYNFDLSIRMEVYLKV